MVKSNDDMAFYDGKSLNLNLPEGKEQRQEMLNLFCQYLKSEDVPNDKKTNIHISGYEVSDSEFKKLFESMKNVPVVELAVKCEVEGFSAASRMGKGMRDESVALMSQFISANSSLQTVDLSGTSFVNASESSQKVAEALALNSNIKSVNLSNVNFSSSGAKGLADAIAHDGFHYLGLNNSNIGHFRGKCSVLWPAIAKNENMDRLEFENAKISSKDLCGLAASFSQNTSIQYMNFSGNEGINSNGFAELGGALANCKNVAEAKFKNMRVENKETVLLMEGIGQNQQISSLDLGRNPFITGNDKGVLQGAMKAISTNTSLTSVLVGERTIIFEALVRRNQGIKDALEDYSKSVLAPKLVLCTSGEDSPNGRINLSKQVIEQLNRTTRRELFKDLSSNQIKEFSDHWHEILQQVRSSGSKDYNEMGWKALFGEDKKEVEISGSAENLKGWKLINRTSASELQKEGQELSHCVGSYTGKCLTGNSHIISVVNPEGNSVSTIELDVNRNNQSYQKIQHYGKNNGAISKTSKEAEKWLHEEIKHGGLVINYENLGTKEALDDALMTIGFDSLNKDKRKSVVNIFKDMLPKENQQLKENFARLVALEEIEIDVDGERKKYDMRPKLTQSAKVVLTTEQQEAKLGIERVAILEKTQKSLNIIFGDDELKANIALPSEGERNKKNKFGQVVLQGENLSDKTALIGEVFGANKVEIVGESIHVIGMQPKAVMSLLERKSQPPVEVAPIAAGPLLNANLAIEL